MPGHLPWNAFLLGAAGGVVAWCLAGRGRRSADLAVVAAGATAWIALRTALHPPASALLGALLLTVTAVMTVTTVGSGRARLVSLGGTVLGLAAVIAGLPAAVGVPAEVAGAAMVVVTAAALGVWRDTAGCTALALLFAASIVAGTYAAVPDTEGPFVVGGATAGAAAVALAVAMASPWRPRRSVSPPTARPRDRGRGWCDRSIAWLPWTSAWVTSVLVGGRTRWSSVVGSFGTIGVLVVWAALVALSLRAGRTLSPPRWAVGVVVVGHLVLVVVASRVAGLRADTASALAIVLAGWALAGVGAVVVARRSVSLGAPNET
jgi:hypothetical protein